MPIERWRNKEGKIEKEREGERKIAIFILLTLYLSCLALEVVCTLLYAHTHTLNAYTDAGLFRLQLTQKYALRWSLRNCVHMRIKVF